MEREALRRRFGVHLSRQVVPDRARQKFAARLLGVQLRRSPRHLGRSGRSLLALHDADVPAELHIFASGGHGFGLRPGTNKKPVNDWPARFVAWLGERGFTADTTPAAK